MSVLRCLCSRLTEESQRDLTHGIEGGQEGRQRERDEHCHVSVSERVGQYLILRPETSRDQRETGEREPADQECGECDRHLLAQPAHIEHILGVDVFICMLNTMLHTVNDGARTQEQERLEKSVGDQMERGGDVSSDPYCCDHESQLRDCGVSKHAFNVVLR